MSIRTLTPLLCIVIKYCLLIYNQLYYYLMRLCYSSWQNIHVPNLKIHTFSNWEKCAALQNFVFGYVIWIEPQGEIFCLRLSPLIPVPLQQFSYISQTSHDTSLYSTSMIDKLQAQVIDFNRKLKQDMPTGTLFSLKDLFHASMPRGNQLYF